MRWKYALRALGAQQFVVSGFQDIAQALQLRGADVLRASLDFYQRFAGHVNTHQLQLTNQFGLPNAFFDADAANIGTDADSILSYFLLGHSTLPQKNQKWSKYSLIVEGNSDTMGPKLVHMCGGADVKEVKIEIDEEQYDLYSEIGTAMLSTAEETMEMILRVAAHRIQKKKRNLEKEGQTP